MRSLVACLIAVLLIVPVCLLPTTTVVGQVAPGSARNGAVGNAEDDSDIPEFVPKTEKEWAKILTREQFAVTRMKLTEPPNSGKYAHYHGKGIFACVCCGTPLFDARTKFESGTGWPSFYAPIKPQRIAQEVDYSAGSPRVEVTCRTCGAHLGHVFNDGPPPTGLRFCLNSVALKLQTPGSAKAKAKAKPKADAKAKPRADDPAETAEPEAKPADAATKTTFR